MLRNGSVVRLLATYLVFKACEWRTWVAVLIYAFDHDAATAVGIVATAQLIPAALVAPFSTAIVGAVTVRVQRVSPLATAYGIQPWPRP